MADIKESEQTCYVAFCDILGFGNRVLADQAEAREAYRQFAETLSEYVVTNDQVFITMYSDSILVRGVELKHVTSIVQIIWFHALFHDLMLRGGIAHGTYWQLRKGDNLLVVSDALVRAVKLEATVSFPAVVLADDIDIPDELWLAHFEDPKMGALLCSILHFRDRNIINPFNLMWLFSAGTRTRKLLAQHPQYEQKYRWFLALHQAVTDRRTLVPQEVVNRFLAEGKIGPIPPATQP